MSKFYKLQFVPVILCFMWVLLMAGSCTSYKQIVYHRNIPDSVKNVPVASVRVTPYIDPVIQPKDNLFIVVQTIDQQPTNTPITPQVIGTYNPLNSTQVDMEGNIELSLIGRVKVAGLTTKQAQDVIEEKAKTIYKDPVVNVKISNNDITVIGEVNKPSTFTFTNEKVSLMDAIGMAGDLTIYGRRDNILLTREENGEKKFIRFDIRNTDMYSSPYFYLRHGDVVYVEPSKAKIGSSDNRLLRNLTIVSSLISVAAFVLAFVRR